MMNCLTSALTRTAIVAFTGLLVCVACAAPSAARPGVETSNSSDTPTPTGKDAPRNFPTNPFDDPDSPYRVVYDDGLISDPIPENAPPPEISKQDALDYTHTENGRIGSSLRVGDPTETLRMVSTALSDDPSPAPATPSWVLIWPVPHPDIGGGVDMTEEDGQALAARSTCEFVMVVDATKGIGTATEQICEERQ
jgi:hypothetical protein